MGGRFRLGGAIALAAVTLAWNAGAASATPVYSALPAEMAAMRYMPDVATLASGKVLIAGGYTGTERLRSAELFDPATGKFEALAAETGVTNAEGATATLPSGKVLIAGGYNQSTFKTRQTAELFNPATNKFETTGELVAPRDAGVAVVLKNGKVLIAGGGNDVSSLGTAELYDPETGEFEALTAEMTTPRYAPAAAALPNGDVLIAGGYAKFGEDGIVSSAEVYDPETGKFQALAAHLTTPIAEPGTAVLPNGEVLIVGGFDNESHNLKITEQFNPSTMAFTRGPDLGEERDGPAAARLQDGRVLIVGGAGGKPVTYFKNAEIESAGSAAVTTGAAAAIGASTATLNGTVFSEALATSYFQFGTSSAYGSSTAPQSIAPSLSALPESAALSGLTQGTVYHFRLVAQNAAGTSFGADQTFTTTGAPGKKPPVRVRPTVSGATQSASRWRAGGKLAAISRRRPPVGTRFSFSLNTKASVSFRFVRSLAGRKVGHRCVARTKGNAGHRACSRSLTAGTLTFSGHAGRNKVAFQGRISNSKRLAAGSYTLLITAGNAAGRSTPVALKFMIVR